MDKGFVGDDSTSYSSNTSSSSKDLYIKHVSINSHKISKPMRKPSPLATTASSSSFSLSSSASAISILDPNSGQAQPQSQQPPVYNINKNDFRDIVQKLTGSPAHERSPTPTPPVTHSRPPSSRLQRIRPPPLPQISHRPPQISQLVPRPHNGGVPEVAQPFTPLPPLPVVHAAAESPISAYMRILHSSASAAVPSYDVGQRVQTSLLPPAVSPVSVYMNSIGPTQQLPLIPSLQQLPAFPSSAAYPSPFPVLPLSPLPFGCIPSPRSPYGTLLSSTGQLGLPQLPLSPTMPVPSPRWKGV